MYSLTKRYGGWAIVTGASSGIGKCFARRLARAGMNVVLVARSEEALRGTAEEIEEQYAVQTRVMPLDLTDVLASETLFLETLDLDVGLLINNAAAEQRGAFVRHTADELRSVITLNVTAPTELGQRFAERFIAQKRGGIIFVSGSIGYQAVPYLANYAATKAHQVNLAEALYYELHPHGVDVLGLSPGLTRTNMLGRLQKAIQFGRIGMLQLTPDYVVKQGLKHLGRRPSVVVGKQYKFFAILTKRVLSRATGAWLFGVLMQIAFSNRTLLGPRGDQQSVAGANPTSLTHVPTS